MNSSILEISPKIFVGREIELNNLQKDFSRSKTCFINGFHGIGKTTFGIEFSKKMVNDNLDKIIYINFQEPIFASEEIFLQFINEKTKGFFKGNEKTKDFFKGTNKSDRLKFPSQILNLPSDTIVIIDEIERFLNFYNTGSFIDILRALSWGATLKVLQDMPYILIITKLDWGREELKFIFDSPRLQYYPQIRLGCLDKGASIQLISTRFSTISEPFQSSWINIILQLSGGHPHIINQAINIIDFENIERIEINLFATTLLDKIDLYFFSIWKDLDNSWKISVIKILVESFLKEKHQLEETTIESLHIKYNISHLQKTGVINYNEEIFSPLFSWWLIINYKNLVDEIKSEVKSKLTFEKIKNSSDTINSFTKTINTFSDFINFK